MIGFLLISMIFGAIVMRYQVRRDFPDSLHYDEAIYFLLAIENTIPLTYDPRPVADILARTLKGNVPEQMFLDRVIPDFMKKPLFKHPPLFTALLTPICTQFTESQFSRALWVPMLSGALMIMTVFLFAYRLWGLPTGFFACLLLMFDPFLWTLNARLLMDSTLAFLICACLALFILNRRELKYWPYCGLLAGLALLTKYTGALPLIIILAHALIYDGTLFFKRRFYLIYVLALLVFSPWLAWNFKIYGADMLHEMIWVHAWTKQVAFANFFMMLVPIGFVLFLYQIFKTKRIHSSLMSYILALIVLGFLLHPDTFSRLGPLLSWNALPVHGENLKFMLAQPWNFYWTQWLSASPFYLAGFLGMVFAFCRGDAADRLVALTAFIIIVSMQMVGQYETRYVLPAVPFLMILAARLIVILAGKVTRVRSCALRWAGASAGSFVLAYSAAKTIKVGILFFNKPPLFF